MAQLRTSVDPYASVRVAVYEPLIVAWWSVPRLVEILTTLLRRQVPPRKGDVAGGAAAPTIARFDWRPAAAPPPSTQPEPHGPAAIEALVRSPARTVVVPAEEQARRGAVVRALLADPAVTPERVLEQLAGGNLPHLLAVGGLHQALSPIGIYHLYRQLYFDAGASVGPFEHAFTVAPLEQMEVAQESIRRDTFERTEMFGSETTLEKTAESTTTEEISDQVSADLRRDMQLGVSGSTEGSMGVWSVSAAGSFTLDMSSEKSRTLATTRTATQTRKSSETLRKTYSLTVRSVTEVSQRTTTRRVIRNDGAEPVSYGLRRVLRRIRVKLQSLGPRLVWQVYVDRPGVNLSTSKMVMFREADAIAPGPAPDAPPRPPGGVDHGDQTVRVQLQGGHRVIEVSMAQDPARKYLGLTIDSITDAAPEKGSTPPGIRDAAAPGVPVTDANGHPIAVVYTFQVIGDPRQVTVSYTLTYDPSDEALAVWHQQVAAVQAAWDAQQLEAAFDRHKRMIEARSRVRPRPANDLRDEERYELMNRMISLAFHDAPPDALPAPIEIELFNRYFEAAAIFYQVHPAWWRPRWGANRADDYEVTEESEPARFGKSLGWLIQLDGDRRRNELLNSPWVRVCVPIRPGVEREAIDWLSRHIEGRVGYSLEVGSPLARLLADVEARRQQEHVAAPGPEYVTLDGEIPPGREDAAAAYPVIDEFEVTVPTEGFLYERITTE